MGGGRGRRPRGTPLRQLPLPFLDRRERRERRFRRAIVAGTSLALVGIVAAWPGTRDLARRAASGVRHAARAAVSLGPDRDEVDDDWRARRAKGVAEASATYARVVAESSPAIRRLLDYAGLGPGEAVLRWGNYDRILVLPGKVFAPDDAGRSYRLRPNVRSVWLRGVDLTHGMNGFFLVPDTPELPRVLEGTGASVVPDSVQTTNSWGCRGPEPDPDAPIRGLVLGDSNMQGYFIGDDQTPSARLGRALEARFHARASILNTGHLGYSTEQYYFSLAEYLDRFRPHFVVLAPCLNDFGDVTEVLAGRGDWDETRYWLERIYGECRRRQVLCITAPVPYDHQVEGPRREGAYPGRLNDVAGVSSLLYCFAIEDLIDELLRLKAEAARTGSSTSSDPLYNGHLGDHHFSPLGAEVWGKALARRIAGHLEWMRATGRWDPGPPR